MMITIILSYTLLGTHSRAMQKPTIWAAVQSNAGRSAEFQPVIQKHPHGALNLVGVHHRVVRRGICRETEIVEVMFAVGRQDVGGVDSTASPERFRADQR